MTYKIVSLNLQGYTNWELRRDAIRDYINLENPHFIFLQEVKHDLAVSPYNQADEINQLLDEQYAYSISAITRFYKPSVGDPYKEGLSLLSRAPIVRNEALVLTQRSDDKHQRIVLSADVTVNDSTTIKLCNVHFSNNHNSVGQLQELFTILNERKEQRIISGDFNIFVPSEQEDLYKDTYSLSTDYKDYISYPSQNQTLDYMLLPNEYTYVDIHTQIGLSDHTAIVYSVEI